MPIHVSAELSHVCPLEDITAHAAALESNGFYRVWVPDTVVSPWEEWLAASLIMQTTSRIRLGLGVTNPYAPSSGDCPDGSNHATGQWGTPDPVHWQRERAFSGEGRDRTARHRSRGVRHRRTGLTGWGADECERH